MDARIDREEVGLVDRLAYPLALLLGGGPVPFQGRENDDVEALVEMRRMRGIANDVDPVRRGVVEEGLGEVRGVTIDNEEAVATLRLVLALPLVAQPVAEAGCPAAISPGRIRL